MLTIFSARVLFHRVLSGHYVPFPGRVLFSQIIHACFNILASFLNHFIWSPYLRLVASILAHAFVPRAAWRADRYTLPIVSVYYHRSIQLE